ncbi:MAG: hypothetical protein ABIJ86_06150 [Spirochaetota bacterium]
MRDVEKKKLETIDRFFHPSASWQWLEMEKYLVKETEVRMPIQVCDNQGPIDGARFNRRNCVIAMVPYEELKENMTCIKANSLSALLGSRR